MSNPALRGQLERIKFEREVEAQRIAERNQILRMFQSAFGTGPPGGVVPGSDDFNQAVNLFQPGGQFGAGGLAEIERGGQEAIAAGQLGLAQTGMSSGTAAAGLKARALADVAIGRKTISDERVTRLSSALTARGQAKLTAEQIAAQKEAERIRFMGSFN
jgi:D-serine dehydratase